MLTTLRDELVKSIYSEYYESERGNLQFDQLTWFSVADRLKREKDVMMQERVLFKKQISEQDVSNLSFLLGDNKMIIFPHGHIPPFFNEIFRSALKGSRSSFHHFRRLCLMLRLRLPQ